MIDQQADPFRGGEAEVVVTLVTDLEVLLELLHIEEFATTAAPHPQVVGYLPLLSAGWYGDVLRALVEGVAQNSPSRDAVGGAQSSWGPPVSSLSPGSTQSAAPSTPAKTSRALTARSVGTISRTGVDAKPMKEMVS